jgi:hypothetical protein
LALQPDASQATAFGAAMALIAVRRGNGAARPLISAACAALVALAWFRPDPLQPVPEVEEILRLAWRMSPVLGLLAFASALLAALAPLLALRALRAEVRLGGAALALCLAIWVGAPFVGAFPVPLVGVGLTPIIGSWLGVGLLAAAMRRATDGISD